MTSGTDLSADITAVVRKMLYPSPLMHWMDGLTQAERIGRIKRSKYSTLRYAIRQFLITQINTQTTLYDTHRIAVIPMDDEVIFTMRRQEEEEVEVEVNVSVAYPDWLLAFLDDDENFSLMLPECDEKIGEVTQRIYEWCRANPPYNLLVEAS